MRFFLLLCCNIFLTYSLIVSATTVSTVQGAKDLILQNEKIMSVLELDSEADIKHIQQLSGAISGSHVYKVTTANKGIFILKWISKHPIAAYEMEMQKIASQKDLAAEVYYHNPKTDLIIMEYLYKSKLPKAMGRLNYFVYFLSDMHHITQTKEMRKINPYKILADNFQKLTTDYTIHPEFARKLKTVLDTEEKMQIKYSHFSHNALTVDNIFYFKKQIKAISWQHAGLGDPYYDVAASTVWFFPWLARPEEVLIEYLGYQANTAQIQRFYQMQNLVKAVEASKILLRLAEEGQGMPTPEMSGKPLSEFLIALDSGTIKLGSGNGNLARFATIILNSLRV